MAEKLEDRGADIKTRWRHFAEVLCSNGFVVGADYVQALVTARGDKA